MKLYIEQLKQFLSDEKELLTDLAFDVANANTDFTYREAKWRYDAQVARVNAIQDSIDLAGITKKKMTSN